MTKEEYLALADEHAGHLGYPAEGDVFLMEYGVPNIYDGKNVNANLLGGKRLILSYVWVAQEKGPPCAMRASEVVLDKNLSKIKSIDELATRIAFPNADEPIENASVVITEGYLLGKDGTRRKMDAPLMAPDNRPRTYYSDLTATPGHVMIPYEASDALDFLAFTVLGFECINQETAEYLKLQVPTARLKIPDIYELYIDPKKRLGMRGIPAITSRQPSVGKPSADDLHIAQGKRWVLKDVGRIVMPSEQYLVFNFLNGQILDSLSETRRIDGRRITKIDMDTPVFSDPTVDTWNLHVGDVSFYVEISAGNEVYIPTDDEYTEDIFRQTKTQIKDLIQTLDGCGIEDPNIDAAKQFLENAIAVLSKSQNM